jgi:enediyne biosynthesis protein E4
MKTIKNELTGLFLLGITTFSFGQEFTRLTGVPPVNTGGSYGVNWIDYNNDGYLDLFFANYNGKNYLYLNKQNGEFEKITTGEIATSNSNNSSGPSWADYDNDGYPDLFIATQSGYNNLFFRNIQGKDFIKITEGELVNHRGQSFSSAWADYDNDGYVDLYVTNNTFWGNHLGESDFFYHNKGDGTLERTTFGEMGNEGGDNTGATWCDYNNDGLIDLFVTTWNGKNLLFKNTGDGFEKITGIGLDDEGYSIACTWGDFNNDGWMDLYVGNGPDEYYNYLYLNNGDGTFTKIEDDPSVAEKGSHWNVVSGDFDNDGDLDLFVPSYQGKNKLFRNNGDGSFEKVNEGSIVNAYTSSYSSGAMWGDYDNDGDLDLVIANESGNNDLFRNEGNNNHWLQVKLTGTVSNRSAIGARIKVKATIDGAENWQTRDISSCQGLRSSNLVAHFGLSNAEAIDSLIIIWPSGMDTVLKDVATDQIIHIEENIPPDFLRAGFSADTCSGKGTLTVSFKDKSVVHPDFPITSYEWDFDSDGITDSDEAEPLWVYQTEKDTAFTVLLKITNEHGTSVTTRKNFILLKKQTVSNLNKENSNDRAIYPNPSDGNFTVRLKSAAKLYSTTIFNTSGQIVAYIPCYDASDGENEYSVRLSEITGKEVETGIYFIHMHYGNEINVLSFMVH